jgi:hypothetical protein
MQNVSKNYVFLLGKIIHFSLLKNDYNSLQDEKLQNIIRRQNEELIGKKMKN